MPFQDSVPGTTTDIKDWSRSVPGSARLLLVFCPCVSAGGADSFEVRDIQVGNASVYLRLLLRTPRPVPAEKEEKEERRGAAAGLRDRGLTIWDCKRTWVYPEKNLCKPEKTSGPMLRDYFHRFSLGVVLSESK